MGDKSIAPNGDERRGGVRPRKSPDDLPALQSTRLLDQLRERVRFLHYSIHTEDAYVHWVRSFVRFHGLKHPRDLTGSDVEAFLSWLASERKVAPATHRQALSALLFLYLKVLGMDLPWMTEIGRPKQQRRLPVVMDREEVSRVMAKLDSDHQLFGQLLYGTGMRLSEGLQLRVKDVDFAHRAIIVRQGKGAKDRVVMLPESLQGALKTQLVLAHDLWEFDQATGCSGVDMPHALERKYPRAGSSWGWFWLFPQAQHSTDPRSGVLRRHHQHDQVFQRAMKRAAIAAGITKPVSPHTLESHRV